MPRSLRRIGTLLLWLFAPALCACYVRDSGHDERPLGVVRPESLCPTEPGRSGCPACSTPTGDRCLDRFYESGFRCAGDAQCGGGQCRDGYCVFADRDGDGLDDQLEREVAQRNLPVIGFSVYEDCRDPRALLYRVRRHPDAPRRLAITYVMLYDRDCGSVNGHLGDNEAFAITVDLDAAPGSAATVGVIAQAHRHTACQSVSTCVAAPGTSACARSPLEAAVVIYSSGNKHASYLDRDVCADNCFDECDDERAPPAALIQAGQPSRPLTRDLTDEKFILAADGWEPALLHFDAWGGAEFGGAGRPRDQLFDLLAPVGP